MSDDPHPTVTAIIPCNDVEGAERGWSRLGFIRSHDQDFGDYRMLADGAGGTIHLQAAVPGWLPPGRNPFGVYIYTPRVNDLAALLHDEIIGLPRAPRHRDWGMYEFAVNAPDDLLVRIGWPSRLVTSV